MKTTLLLITSFTLLSFNASAAEINTTKLCKKMQHCMIKQMQSESLPEGMEEMIKPMLDNLCASIEDQFHGLSSGIRSDIGACINAMESASCDVLMNKPDQIKECEQLHQGK